MASSPVPAEGSSTRSAGVMAAAVHAARPSGTGVENCWSAWLSSERRVWVGRRPAIFASIGSAAAGEPDLRRSAFPYFRRNRTVAASQASYAVFQSQAPAASEAPNADSIAARRMLASIRRPRSRSGRISLAASAMAAGAGASDGIAERTAAELEGFVMKRTSGEQERAEPLGALSRPDRLKPVPAGLSLSSRRRPHAPVLDAQRRRRLTREVVRVR